MYVRGEWTWGGWGWVSYFTVRYTKPWRSKVCLWTLEFLVTKPTKSSQGKRTSVIFKSFSMTWDDRCSQFLMLLYKYHSFSCFLSGFFVVQTDIFHRRAGSCWTVVEFQLHMKHRYQTFTLPLFAVTSLMCIMDLQWFLSCRALYVDNYVCVHNCLLWVWIFL